jgi:preprotein translocase subunit SecG
MLVGLLTTLLIVDGLFMILLILIQKGKGSMGLGALGGGAQTLFGGSGGQDLFQKITWVAGAIFMGGSLGLAILKSRGMQVGEYVGVKPMLPIAKARQNQARQSVPQAQTTQPVSAAPTAPVTETKTAPAGETKPQ